MLPMPLRRNSSALYTGIIIDTSTLISLSYNFAKISFFFFNLLSILAKCCFSRYCLTITALLLHYCCIIAALLPNHCRSIAVIFKPIYCLPIVRTIDLLEDGNCTAYWQKIPHLSPPLVSAPFQEAAIPDAAGVCSLLSCS